jgi:mannose-6-phosphate isomerase-like protein (cupin superfamily)
MVIGKPQRVASQLFRAVFEEDGTMARRNSIVIPEAEAPRGEMGQLYLATGDLVALRLWDEYPEHEQKTCTARDYETVGYVLEGKAILTISNNSVELHPGDSWVVPMGKVHTYEILEHFRAVEATSPPGREMNLDDIVHNRGQHYSQDDVLA